LSIFPVLLSHLQIFSVPFYFPLVIRMAKFFKNRTSKLGKPAGSLIHIGDQKIDDVHITAFHYNGSKIEEKVLHSLNECMAYRDSTDNGVVWIDIDGLHRVDILESVGECFGVHPLTLEDILNTDQRPKVEEYDNYLYIAVKMLDFMPDGHIGVEQISIILMENFVLSFQENVGDIFDSIRDDLRKSRGRLRREGADFLAYTLLDSIVDKYFVLMEQLGDQVDDIESKLIDGPVSKFGHDINNLKREMLMLRRSIWPMREVMNILVRSDSRFIGRTTVVFLQDVYDHIIHVIETLEIFREMLSGTLDIYLTSMSNRMNEIMKVLTVISTIFIPLTFIVGIYGMNFHFMPELSWRWGYPLVWVVMISVVVGMFMFFRRKGWL
jgi:magnesium transporter